MKYYLKDIKWAYTFDGEFIMPFVENKENTKIKNILTDEVMSDYVMFKDIMTKYYNFPKDKKYTIVESKIILPYRSIKIDKLLPASIKIKYFLNKHKLNDIRHHVLLNKEQISKLANKIQGLLYMDNKRIKKEQEKLNAQIMKKQKKDAKINQLKAKKTNIEDENRDKYMNF